MDTSITDTLLSDPPVSILHSSELLGWSNVMVEKRYHPTGEYKLPSSSSHIIALHQGPPVSIEHTRKRQSFRGILASGHAQILPAGVENICRHQGDCDHTLVFLAPTLLQRVAEDYNQPHIELLAHFRAYDTRIENICSALLTELLEDGPSGRLYVDGLATALAAHLIHSYTSNPHNPPEITKGLSAAQFRNIRDLIEDRLAEDLGLIELSAEVGLRPSHFSNLFRKTTGLAPHAYIMQRRLERAQHLLRDTGLLVGDIAATVGFYDQSHLVRHMRKVMGVTPSYIRKNHLS